MLMEIDVFDFEKMFKLMDRDNFSKEGYTALFDYYDEFEDFKLDVIAICCEVNEYTKEEVLNEYSYLVDKEESKSEEDYFLQLIEEIRDNTGIIELDNGNFLIWVF